MNRRGFFARLGGLIAAALVAMRFTPAEESHTVSFTPYTGKVFVYNFQTQQWAPLDLVDADAPQYWAEGDTFKAQAISEDPTVQVIRVGPSRLSVTGDVSGGRVAVLAHG